MATQIVKINESLLYYFEMVLDCDNQGEDFRELARDEFKMEIEKALNSGVAKKEIKWIS